VVIVVGIVGRLLRTLVDTQRIGRLILTGGFLGTLLGRQCTGTTLGVGVDIVEPIVRAGVDTYWIGTDLAHCPGRFAIAGRRTIVSFTEWRSTITVAISVVQWIQRAGVVTVVGTVTVAVLVCHSAATDTRPSLEGILLAEVDT